MAGQRRPIWALGGIDVAKGERSLVISLDSQADADDYAEVTDRAVDSVTKVWGKNWKQKAVIYLPAKQSEMESVLGAQPNTYTQIAAVTMAELDTPQVGAPVRIVANPKLFEELGKQGRRIVLTHETTHVASVATASPVPLWLAEGFADYVAFDRRVRAGRIGGEGAVQGGPGRQGAEGAAGAGSVRRLVDRAARWPTSRAGWPAG